MKCGGCVGFLWRPSGGPSRTLDGPPSPSGSADFYFLKKLPKKKMPKMTLFLGENFFESAETHFTK